MLRGSGCQEDQVSNLYATEHYGFTLGGDPHATTFGRVYPVGLPRRSPACPGGLDGGANDPRLAPYLDLVPCANACPVRGRRSQLS